MKRFLTSIFILVLFAPIFVYAYPGEYSWDPLYVEIKETPYTRLLDRMNVTDKYNREMQNIGRNISNILNAAPRKTTPIKNEQYYDQLCKDEFGPYSYLTEQKDGENLCGCSGEYIMRDKQCITRDESCKNNFGSHSRWTMVTYEDGKNMCYCETGYEWNNNQTACSEIMLSSCSEGYILFNNKCWYVYVDGTIIKTDDSNSVYLIENGKKRPIPTELVFNAKGFKWKDLRITNDLAFYPLGPEVTIDEEDNNKYGNEVCETAYGPYWTWSKEFTDEGLYLCDCKEGYSLGSENGQSLCFKTPEYSDGTLIKTASLGSVWLIENGKKRPIRKKEIFEAMGYNWEDIITISQIEIDSYGPGPDVSIDENNKDNVIPKEQKVFSHGTLSDGDLIRVNGKYGVYLIEGGEVSPIKSAEIFNSKGYKWEEIIDIEQYILDAYSLGDEITISEKIRITVPKIEEFQFVPHIPSSVDSDSDGLTDVEETFYHTEINNPDSDTDTISDGQEILNLTNPNRAERYQLAGSGLINIYTNQAYSYSFFYPSSWLARALPETNNQEVLVITNTGEFFIITVENNTEQLTPVEWYLSKAPSIDPALLYSTIVNNQEAVWNPEHSTLYISKDSRIYILSYNVGTEKEANFKTSFELMINSFRFVVPFQGEVDGTLIKYPHQSRVYLIESGKKRAISGEAFKRIGFKWEDIVEIPMEETYANGDPVTGRLDGTLIKYVDKLGLYLIENGKKRAFASDQVFEALGFKWDDVIEILADEVYLDGPIIE